MEVHFVNSTADPLTVSWIDFDGVAIEWCSLGAGETVRQQTFATHPWLVVSSGGQCFGVFIPADAPPEGFTAWLVDASSE